MQIRGFFRAVTTAVILADAPGPAAQSSSPTRQPPLPPPLDSYLTTYVRLTAAQRRLLLSGGPVTALLETNASQEVAVFGATWVDALPSAYVERLSDIETFERGGGFRVTKRISDPPRLEDFALLDLPKDDVADLKNCRVAACAIKLSQPALDRVRKEIDWSKPTASADATALARRLAFEYITGYLEGGNARLAVYRDAERPTFVADEFRSMVDRLPSLVEYLPEVRTYLLDYPKAPLPDSSSFLYYGRRSRGKEPGARDLQQLQAAATGSRTARARLRQLLPHPKLPN